MKLRSNFVFLLCLSFRAFATDFIVVRGPFVWDRPAGVPWGYSPHDRRVEIHLSAFGPVAPRACQWLLEAAPDCRLPHVFGPLRGNKINFLSQQNSLSGSIRLSFPADETLRLRASPHETDTWSFYMDLGLQVEFPDLQSWNQLFTTTGPLEPLLPKFFRHAHEIPKRTPRLVRRRRDEEMRILDSLLGLTTRSGDSPHARLTKVYGKLRRRGFRITAIVLTLDTPSDAGSVEYAMIYGAIKRGNGHFEIVEPYGKSWWLDRDDLDPFLERTVVVQGFVDQFDKLTIDESA